MNRNLRSRLENLLQAENTMIYNSYNLKWQVDKNCSCLYLADPNFDIKRYTKETREFKNYGANQTHPTVSIQNDGHTNYVQVPDAYNNLSMTQTNRSALDINQNYLQSSPDRDPNTQYLDCNLRNSQNPPFANLPRQEPPQIVYVPVPYAPTLTNNGLPQRVPLFTQNQDLSK